MYVHRYMYVSKHVCMYLCMYVCIYIYVHHDVYIAYGAGGDGRRHIKTGDQHVGLSGPRTRRCAPADTETLAYREGDGQG
jgi:hypothetical protein